ncbi:MAG TPA: thioredoxin domain-containing protein [Anaerolineales bacterium]|nr:thioredoxin domain-containing protein [Anaerolineales bacterium]
MPPRKKKTPDIPVVEEEVFPDPPVSQEETFTFKRTHFYAVFTVLAFAAGVLLGYVVWGYNTQPPTFIVQAPPVSPTPEPLVYDIETAGFPSLGPADAPVVIVEFSDYQCPFCYRWYAQVYNPLLEAYKGKIRLVFRNYPLSFHENAFPSAEAALCAGDQNAYWEYHNALFDNYPTMYNQEGIILDQETYNRFARDLGLNVDTFETCMTSHKYQQFILDDMEYANNLPVDTNGEAGVGGTPTFFINGHRLGGAYPFEAFQEIIEAELAKSN